MTTRLPSGVSASANGYGETSVCVPVGVRRRPFGSWISPEGNRPGTTRSAAERDEDRRTPLRRESVKPMRMRGRLAESSDSPKPRFHFQGDEPPQLEILGAEDLAHAALPEPFRDAVVREGFPDHTGHRSRHQKMPGRV